MPELPEVETVRRDLDALISGRRIVGVSVTGVRTVRRHSPADLVDAGMGATVRRIHRHGKYLMLDLDTSETIFVHLRMSGMLLWTPDPTAELLPHTHVRLAFDGGAELRFVDPRTFGEWWVSDSPESDLSHIGPDAWFGITSPGELGARFAHRSSGLKIALVNQGVVAGIGNIYADEIAWTARVRPERPAGSLTNSAVSRVFDAMREVLGRAIEARGSSLADKQYVDVFGALGEAQDGHAVYARAGEPCRRCGSIIVRLPIGARSAYSCRRCQK